MSCRVFRPFRPCPTEFPSPYKPYRVFCRDDTPPHMLGWSIGEIHASWSDGPLSLYADVVLVERLAIAWLA